jgi:hypothetical protein
MECFFTEWGLCFLHDLIEPQDAAVFKAASESLVFSCENIFHDSPAAAGGFALRTVPAVHSRTWHDVQANAVDIEHDDKSRLMLITTNNYPMAMDAAGLPVIRRDSP